MTTPRLPPHIRVFERGWLSSNNVLCLGDQSAVVDTGHVKHAAETVHLVDAALQGRPLADIAHTHLHSDHCGGTAALQAAHPKACTWVPEPSLPHVQAWDEDALTFGSTAQRCARFSAHQALVPGQSVRLGGYEWQIHAAPGHDALAVLLFEPRHGILIAGDAMWEHGVGVIFPHIEGSDGFDTFTDTLVLIEDLDPQTIIPGHGAPFFRDGGAIAAAMARARERIAYFNQHPAQHALYAAKVLIKYQLLDVESMAHADFQRWLDQAPALHMLHTQHRPDLDWQAWLALVLAPLYGKGVLRRDDTHVYDGA
ncbi:MBL fold metallo-hydrolase [Ottowia sp.]|uniref:MBL fold metallo-hydrolase n=1 Tax=Ottowia sp. TaxID=1898956 RepID=UPI002CAF19BB|nr:MBL fold metallo-hydrolase [Ottowia sp.]HRN75224.1 MBL fold metallo-hydrolase [Ottowia sp.]HRQ01673.1 MBL fold metallo-hydrolase [Ottowia sp.]